MEARLSVLISNSAKKRKVTKKNLVAKQVVSTSVLSQYLYIVLFVADLEYFANSK